MELIFTTATAWVIKNLIVQGLTVKPNTVLLKLVITREASSCCRWEQIARPIDKHHIESERSCNTQPKLDVSIKSLSSDLRERCESGA